MKQKARKSIKSHTTTKPSGATPSVHPCFHCGFIFAKKDDYTQHMERYHQPKPSDAVSSRCHECGRDFRNDEKAKVKEHLLFHDLAKIIAALRCSELRKKRMLPIVVRAPLVDATIPTPSWKEEIDRHEDIFSTVGDATPVNQMAAIGKLKGRPRSKSVFVVPDIKAETTAPAVVSPSQAAFQSEPPKKRRRISNETSPSDTATSKPAAAATPSPVASAPINLVQRPSPIDVSPDITDQRPAVTSAASTPPAVTPSAQTAPQSSSAQKSTPTLQSACPNCGQNLGKPWHLMDHMIQNHEAQLLRLHRTLKKPEAGGIMITIPQTFIDRHCAFCQLAHADMQACLLHVVRSHRSRLFECPDNGECTLTCELMCAIGHDSAPKKFTISVKVKRKTTGE